MEGCSAQGMGILHKYGKVEKSISRDIIVPADIPPPHALHYPAENRWVDILAKQTGWEVINAGANGRELPRNPFVPRLLAEQQPVRKAVQEGKAYNRSKPRNWKRDVHETNSGSSLFSANVYASFSSLSSWLIILL